MRKGNKRNAKSLVGLSAATLFAAFPHNPQAQTINCLAPLVFGEIVPCGASSPVTVYTDDTRTTGGCASTGGSPYSRATCVVSQGFPPVAIQMSVTANTFTINNGAASMSVTAFNIITNANGRVYTSSTPALTVPIGATLNVGASQAGGNYSGSFGFSAVFQ